MVPMFWAEEASDGMGNVLGVQLIKESNISAVYPYVLDDSA